MGRRKIVIANLTFDDNETIESKISRVFAPENLLCLSREQLKNYQQIISHQNIQLVLNDKGLMATVYSFFENNLNTSITSAKTFMHRNTLNYRLEKIRKFTGLNLKLFEHAVVFKNLIIINSIIKKENV